MLGKNITIKGICTAILFVTMGVSQVSLTIDNNVDLTAGTLDIYMTNTAGCSYCDENPLVNTTQDLCESEEGASWVFDSNMDDSACSICHIYI